MRPQRTCRAARSRAPGAIVIAGLLCLACSRAGFDTLPQDAGADTAGGDAASGTGVDAGVKLESYYLRSDGSGDDSSDGLSRDTAFASLQGFIDAIDLSRQSSTLHVYRLQLDATEADDHYRPARYDGEIGHPFRIVIEGGHVYRDGIDRGAHGYSRITAADNPGFEPGLLLHYGRGSRHWAHASVHVSRVIFDSVRSAVEIDAYPSLDHIKPEVVLEDVHVTATGHGVRIEYPKSYSSHGPSVVRLVNTSIVAGIGLTGEAAHGVFLHGVMPQITLQDSSVTSAWGHGLFVTQHAHTGASTNPDGFFLKVERSALIDSLGDGLRWEDTGDGVLYRTRDFHIDLQRSRFTGNGGSGLHVLMRPRYSDGSDLSRLFFEAQNILVADNRGDGLHLEAQTDAPEAPNGFASIQLLLVNSTIANNRGMGLLSSTQHRAGAEHTIFNSLLAGNDIALKIADGDLTGMALLENYNAFFANPNGTMFVNGSALPPAGQDLLVDPQFSAAAPEPYQLAAASPLLDAGQQAYAPAVDLLGETRPQGSAPSIGAFEGAAQ